MLSPQAPIFYGDIRSHERVSVSFSTFIGHCKAVLKERCVAEDGSSDSRKPILADIPTDQSDLQGQIYLAQVPIVNVDCEEKVQLNCLKEDIEAPPFLASKTLASVNLWMNSTQSRSSTHYDPHHNLLCIVSGCKQVVLWPPSASPFLYPLPIYGEASNHCAVDIQKPDFCAYPRAKRSDDFSQKIILHAGDALFIPEGWYHQVDSEDLTIAVNFWWRSDMMSGLSEHMDSYYLRRILKRFFIFPKMNEMLNLASVANDETKCNKNDHPSSWNAGKGENLDLVGKPFVGENLKQMSLLHELDSVAISALHELISLVHDRVKPSQHIDSTKADNMKVDLYNVSDDPIAKVLWTLEPLRLQRVLFIMANNFPRTLEALILHVLSPVAAEVLTRKFEQMDELINEEDRNEFYKILYGVFENQFAAMDALLNGKESFARKV
ncbi:OLC1v1007191C1 [Oldenlandia corymbosa var. corymbosa]|uniref:OLC1v1007191C1 n=1 Tax=Oldenlandia corymbosa var. corymbosa TaxID=529605 RepID=A0AAV1DIQ7_OLDCO|nr:OLC1v1007191C1 [Oldenlandia corymbosa var. corymbosa]